jgi:hypothetical protein
MIRRTNILAGLRRRRKLGRCFLALFAAGSFAASASPCPAMTVAAVHAPGGGAVDSRNRAQPFVASHAHDHGAHAAPHDGFGAAVAGSLGPHDHSHGAAPARSTQAAANGASSEPERHPSGHCPHCPVSAPGPAYAGGGAHAFCSPLDDGSGPTSVQHPTLAKHVVVSAHQAIAPPPISRSRVTRLATADASTRCTVALNLRHCVFLI